MGKELHYCVLQTRVLKQWEVARMLNKALPEGKGEIFYPCVELWHNKRDEAVIKPLFPGYLFVRSSLSLSQLHRLIKEHKRYVESFISELHLNTRRNAQDYGDYVGSDKEDFFFTDLSDEEAAFLDFMLNFTAPEELATKQGTNVPDTVIDTSGSLTEAVKEKLPDRGIFRMSYGYREGSDYVVMEGPLKGFEDHIVTVDVRDHKAYLDIKINEHLTRVGLMIKPKKLWFPEEESGEVLSDGREADISVLKRKMGG